MLVTFSNFSVCGLPVVDHMDDGIGCFGRAGEKREGRKEVVIKSC